MKFPVISEDAAREALRSLPRLGMDEYAGFLAGCITRSDPVKVARQKAFEERITVPFRFIPEKDVFQAVTTVLAEEPGLSPAADCHFSNLTRARPATQSGMVE